VFLKVDSDRARLEREVDVMALVPVPAPKMLWHKPSVLALAALDGSPLGSLGKPSTASPAAWAAAGAVVRQLHDAPLPPRHGRGPDELAAQLDDACEWLIANTTLGPDVVRRNRELAQEALRPWQPVFTHGDLQVDHVFVDGDTVTGVLDWSEGAQGNALWDLATLTLGHPEHLDAVIAGYGKPVDLGLVHAWWSVRSLRGGRWLIEHGLDPAAPGCEFDVLKRQAG
jgi:aminoglycoside phosphotransferase (APT) family kinase protein